MSDFIDEKKIDMKKYRKDFPFFKAIDEHNSKENAQLVYFDTSATAQRPFLVIDAMSHFYATANANPLRGLYDLSERAMKLRILLMHQIALKSFLPEILQKV